MRKGTLIIGFIAIAAILILVASYMIDNSGDDIDNGLSVITSIFPVYDFARIIGGEKASVTMLLPPGAEAHSFEPKPSDIGTLSEADLFIYTTSLMEPWAEDMLAGFDKGGPAVLEAGLGAPVSIVSSHEHDSEESEQTHEDNEVEIDSSRDPHIWLDFDNSIYMVRAISEAMSQLAPEDAGYFAANAEGYVAELQKLDLSYSDTIEDCPSRTIIHGGHYAFGYLAQRYGLDYVAAQGFSPDSEPGPKQIMGLINLMKSTGSKFIFYEELVEPRVAEVISKETGATMLMLHAGHNISKDELDSQKSFIGLMRDNLETLKIGLGYDGN